MVNSITKMTPDNARQPKNKLDVKLQLELHRTSTGKYPDIKEGDLVKIYTKKSTFSKESVPVWSQNNYEVQRIEEKNNQHFYYVAGWDRGLRHEVLKLPKDT